MILTIYLIVNIFASFVANKIKDTFDGPHKYEEIMLQLLVRFLFITAAFFPATQRVPLMALAIVGPLLFLAVNRLSELIINKLRLSASTQLVVSDMLQVATLALVCLNHQAIL